MRETLEKELLAKKCDGGQKNSEYIFENSNLGQSENDDHFRSPKYRLKHVDLWELCCLLSFNFPYGYICGTMGLFILPAEAQRLFPASESIMLGVSLGLVGLTQLVCPIAGKISDSREAQYPIRRRIPFILIGTVSCGLSVLAMWLASSLFLGLMYNGCLFCGMVALNVIYSVQCGLVPDLIDDELQGKASGVVAVNTIGGSGIGFLTVMLASHFDFHFIYPVYFISLILSGILSIITAERLQQRAFSSTLAPLVMSQQQQQNGTPETRTPQSEKSIDLDLSYRQDLEDVRPSAELQIKPLDLHALRLKGPKLGFDEILKCYTIDVSKGYDFFWIFLGRTFYYVAVSCQAFMLYYLRDVIGTKDPDQRKLQIGAIALCAQGVAASVAYPVGRFSDDERVHKQSLIYFACTLMALTYGLFLCSPFFGQWGFTIVISASLIYGAGNGCFLAVDYALALEHLPSRENTAQALGIWGISAFIGSAIGPLVWGMVLYVFGTTPVLPAGEYQYQGYVVMLLAGIAVTILAGGIITLVKKK